MKFLVWHHLIIIIISSPLSDLDLGSASSLWSLEYSLPWNSNKTPHSPLISVQLPRSPVLLTEHQIKKGKPITHLWPVGKLPSTTKALSVHLPSFLHHHTSPRSSVNEHSALKKQSSLRWFTPSVISSTHPPLLATPTSYSSISSNISSPSGLLPLCHVMVWRTLLTGASVCTKSVMTGSCRSSWQ